ncbi:MAG TPA: hypothetical protein DHV15_13550 [Treponema sp.]|uniref:Uncharacterized protein n=1 Tax=Treponema denticola (strain ATCC 35405 / DSM 14222 / CIP 103919 / JCM 8153 / KCTC 15104) TaxID=243275 RepID=Q73J44_TREDE|nr:hypothetical protein TDE_2732 [Treponema denticola ATCC 35405]HCY96510.1 hypothetical protein [Treponema sp.]
MKEYVIKTSPKLLCALSIFGVKLKKTFPKH